MDLSILSTTELVGIIVVILIAIIIFTVIALGAHLENVNRHKDKNDTKRKAMLRRQRREDRAERLYLALAKLPLISRQVRRLHAQYNTICPYGEGVLSRRVINVVVRAFVISVIASFWVVIVNYLALGTIEIYGVACIILAVYVTWTEVLNRDVEKVRRTVNENLSTYMINVKHQYVAHHNISNAVVDAALELPYEIQRISEEIHEILCAQNASDRVKGYVTDRNRSTFLRLLVSQCYETMEKGEIIKGEESLFCKNVEILRCEMLEANINAAEKDYAMSGLTFVCLFPTFFMNFFKKWGMDWEDQMISFYNTYGYFICLINMFFTVVIFNMINKARRISNRYQDVEDVKFFKKLANKRSFQRLSQKLVEIDKRGAVTQMLRTTGREIPAAVFFTKMIVMSVIGVILVFSMIAFSHYSRKQQYLTTITDLETRIGSATSRQRDNINEVCLELISLYKDADMTEVTDEEVLAEIEDRIRLFNKAVKEEMVRIVRDNVFGYQTEGFIWYDIFLCLLGTLMGFVDLLELIYMNYLCNNEKAEEVRQFQLIILLEKEFESITTYQLISEMEAHSIYYREKLRTALVGFTSVEEMLRFLYQNEDNLAFKELIDSLRNVDTVGVSKAFEELESLIASDQKIQNLKNRMVFAREKSLMDIMVYIPTVITVGFYFIVPFLSISIRGVNSIFNSINR